MHTFLVSRTHMGTLTLTYTNSTKTQVRTYMQTHSNTVHTHTVHTHTVHTYSTHTAIWQDTYIQYTYSTHTVHI